MLDLGKFGATVSFPVTVDAASFSVLGVDFVTRTFLVVSDRIIHLDRRAVAAPETSLRLFADQTARLVCFGGETLSFVLGIGEVDGTIWITEVV